MKIYFTKFIAIFIFGFILISAPAYGQGIKDAFNVNPEGPVQGTAPAAPLGDVATAAGYDQSVMFDSMIGKVILTALSMLGIMFLILLIYAGYLWMTAGGNEQQVSKSQSIITTAIIGLIIVLSAYSISFFVLSSLQDGALQEAVSEEE